jgi:hypothetical protein
MAFPFAFDSWEKENVMNNWLIDGDTIRFLPQGVWGWSGWSGVLDVIAPSRGMSAKGRPIVLADDLAKLAKRLVGQAYTSVGFADLAGKVIQATVLVKPTTLAVDTTLKGQRIACTTTEGTFTLSVSPSLRSGPPPLPDPILVKTGRWLVERAGQGLASTGGAR